MVAMEKGEGALQLFQQRKERSNSCEKEGAVRCRDRRHDVAQVRKTLKKQSRPAAVLL